MALDDDGSQKLHTGYGLASLLWLEEKEAERIARYDRAATVQDLLVHVLTGAETVFTSPHNAHSWGFFDLDKGNWDLESLKRGSGSSKITTMLPTVAKIDPESPFIGKLAEPWCGIRAGTPVCLPFGDLQASVRASCLQDGDAMLNISTSAQLCFPVAKSLIDHSDHLPGAIDVFPYIKDQVLVAAASLNGGNVLDYLAKQICQWSRELGGKMSSDEAFNLISEISIGNVMLPDLPIVVPRLHGERSDPSSSMSFGNISSATNLGVKAIINAALNRGIVENLCLEMMPPKMLKDFGKIKVIRLSGKSEIFEKPVRYFYAKHFPDVSIEVGTQGDACIGCCL